MTFDIKMKHGAIVRDDGSFDFSRRMNYYRLQMPQGWKYMDIHCMASESEWKLPAITYCYGPW